VDIAAAIESAIGTLEVSLREQQLDLWSHATAAVEAPACADDHLVCAVCLDRLYCSFISFFHPFLTPASPFPPSHATPRVLPLPRPLRTLGCPGQVTPAVQSSVSHSSPSIASNSMYFTMLVRALGCCSGRQRALFAGNASLTQTPSYSLHSLLTSPQGSISNSWSFRRRRVVWRVGNGNLTATATLKLMTGMVLFN
jgi:hypothetical protein